MRHRPAVRLFAAGVALTVGSCSPAAQTPPPPPPPSKPIAAPAAAPPKEGTMICRSSVDGRPAKCGTPNAVMVGMKFN
jgi:hypothetical protein